jgi:hypothetical protein
LCRKTKPAIHFVQLLFNFLWWQKDLGGSIERPFNANDLGYRPMLRYVEPLCATWVTLPAPCSNFFWIFSYAVSLLMNPWLHVEQRLIVVCLYPVEPSARIGSVLAQWNLGPGFIHAKTLGELNRCQLRSWLSRDIAA